MRLNLFKFIIVCTLVANSMSQTIEMNAYTICEDDLQNGNHKMHTVGIFDNETIMQLNVTTTKVFTGERIQIDPNNEIKIIKYNAITTDMLQIDKPTNIIIILLIFRDIFGNYVLPNCNEQCVTNAMWDDTYSVSKLYSDSSNEVFYFNKTLSKVITVQTNFSTFTAICEFLRYASSSSRTLSPTSSLSLSSSRTISPSSSRTGLPSFSRTRSPSSRTGLPSLSSSRTKLTSVSSTKTSSRNTQINSNSASFSHSKTQSRIIRN